MISELLFTFSQVLQILDILSNEKQGTAALGSLGGLSSLNCYKKHSSKPSDLADKIIDKILSHPTEVRNK